MALRYLRACRTLVVAVVRTQVSVYMRVCDHLARRVLAIDRRRSREAGALFEVASVKEMREFALPASIAVTFKLRRTDSGST